MIKRQSEKKVRRQRTNVNLRHIVLRNQTQTLVREVKDKHYLAIQNLTDENSIWKKLKHLSLIKSKIIDRNLLSSIEDLNVFFCSSQSFDSAEGESVYCLSEDEYSNSKFYWKNIKFQHVM